MCAHRSKLRAHLQTGSRWIQFLPVVESMVGRMRRMLPVSTWREVHGSGGQLAFMIAHMWIQRPTQISQDESDKSGWKSRPCRESGLSWQQEMWARQHSERAEERLPNSVVRTGLRADHSTPPVTQDNPQWLHPGSLCTQHHHNPNRHKIPAQLFYSYG